MGRKVAYRVDHLVFSYQPPNSAGSPFSLQIDSMTVRRGAFTAIVGRSGSGKTTLLSLLGLVRQPKSGSIELTLTNGEDGSEIVLTSEQLWRDEGLAEMVRAKYLGYALQAGELLPYLSLWANVEFVLRVLGVRNSKGVARNCLQQFYEKSEQPDLMRTPSSVSQGQYQRCVVARALVHSPQILLADEPTGNLDASNARAVLSLLKSYVRSDERIPRTVVLVTHDVEHAIQFADELYVLKRGKLVARHQRGAGSWPSSSTLIASMVEKESYEV